MERRGGEREREGGEETGGWMVEEGRDRKGIIVCIHTCILRNIMCIYIVYNILCTHVRS